ncbi:MAG: fasciclin domain-containing protein, partial [Actinomycetota bacterium]|nr:fasciclin domain-containing protein [Actinomycetota bacterium]
SEQCGVRRDSRRRPRSGPRRHRTTDEHPQLHVISGQSLAAADLAAAGTQVSVQGGELTFSVEADGSLSINGGAATVVCSNITVGNATVHIIDSLLVPPAE